MIYSLIGFESDNFLMGTIFQCKILGFEATKERVRMQGRLE